MGKYDEHDTRLKQVFLAREVNLKFNTKTCRMWQEKTHNVGHILSKHSLKQDPAEIQAVQDMITHKVYCILTQMSKMGILKIS